MSAFLLDSSGTVKSSYNKRQLVPFGEYVPLRELLGKFIQPVAALGEFDPGAARQRLAEFGGMRIGSAICYESIFPNLFAGDSMAGADLYVNITNDGWFGDISGPYQHLAQAVGGLDETAGRGHGGGVLLGQWRLIRLAAFAGTKAGSLGLVACCMKPHVLR